MSWKYCKGVLAFVAMMIVSTSAMAATHNIDIAGFAFSPNNLTITVGDSVVWTNSDAAPHTATSDDAGATFDSGTLTTGMSWGMKFTTPGVIPYHCSIHPSMLATLTVESPQPVPGLGLVGFSILGLLIIGSAAYIIRRNKTITV
ncbi:MAG: cupredoxin family copper-binding protein [Candidatus Zixiibacteriota bacterium]